MTNQLTEVLNSIGQEYQREIDKRARHYLEVSIGEQAAKLGYSDLRDKFKNTYAIVPLREPRKGMKVRIDGRTFVNYAECESGIAIPGYLAKEAGQSLQDFVPNDSMICNFN